MKSISNSDFSLILDKLPIAIRLARTADTPDNGEANSMRLLALLLNRWQKKRTNTPKTNKS